MSDVEARDRALRQLFMRHREQRLGGVSTGCSCSWTPRTADGPLLSQFCAHMAELVASLLPMECTHRLGGLPGAPLCSRRDWHDPRAPGGHVYQSTSGVAHAVKEEA